MISPMISKKPISQKERRNTDKYGIRIELLGCIKLWSSSPKPKVNISTRI